MSIKQSDQIFEQAEIYKVQFTVGSTNYIYVGFFLKLEITVIINTIAKTLHI